MKIGPFALYGWFYFGCLISEASNGLTIDASQGGFKLREFKGEIIASLKGSCLIHNFHGSIVWAGRWAKIYTKDGRSIYKGKGKVSIKGDAKVIQFLGCFVNAKIKGATKITLYPSLMQNNKNFYKYDDEKKGHIWGIFSLDTLWLPRKG